MKRGILIISFMLLSIVSATPTLEFKNEEIQATETVLATITTLGEFTKEIESSDIKFFKGRKQVSLEHDIIYYKGTHYLYIYTTSPTNLTLQIENILYNEADILKSATITKQLNITEKTNESLTIKPGFIFTSSSATIKLINPTSYQLNLTYNDNKTSIAPMQSAEVEITPTQTFSYLNISTYKDFQVPIIYFNTTKNATTFVTPEIKPDLRVDTEFLLLELFTNNESQQTIELFNFGDDNLTNLETTSNISFMEIEELQDIPGRGIQNLTLKLNPKVSGYFQETINISYTQNETQKILQVTIAVFVLPEGTPEENFQVEEENCGQLSGQVCDTGMICNGTISYPKSKEKCCVGLCVELKDSDLEDSSGFGWLIAIVIFAVLGFTGHYFYKKQKTLQAPTPKETIKKTTEKFEKRLAGTKTQRTIGSLAKS